MAKNECITPQAREQDKAQTTQQLADQAQKKFGWKSEVAGAVAGAFVAGNLANIADDEDNSGWYQIAGMLVGAGVGRHKANISQAMQGFVKNVGDHIPDNKLATMWKKSDTFNKTNEMRNAGVNVNIDDAESVRWHQKFWKSFKQVGKDRNNMYEAVFENKYVSSMFTTLSRYNVKTANKLRDILKGINNTVDFYKAKPFRFFDEKYGNNAFRNFDTKAVPLIKKVAGSVGLDRLDDVQAERLYNEAVSMILHGGGKLDDSGAYKYIDKQYRRGNLVAEYKKNPKLLQLHEQLLKDEEFGDFISAYRKTFSEIETDYKAQVRAKMNRIIEYMEGDSRNPRYPSYARLLREMRQRNMNYGEFKQHLKNNDWEKYVKLVSALKDNKSGIKSDLAEQITLFGELSNGLRRFDGYENAYFPQKHNFDKELKAREKWFAEQEAKDSSFKNLSKEKKVSAWETKVAKDISIINGRKRSNKVQVFDDDGHMVKIKEMRDREEAQGYLNGIINNHMRNPEDKEYAKQNIDRIIKEKKVEARDEAGNPIIIDGEQKYVTNYYLEAPPERPDLFSQFNRKEYREEVKWVRQGAIVNKSNHLEHSRETLLPYYLMDTNFDRVYNSYARDVGERIHMLKNDIFNTSDLKVNYLDKINREIASKVSDSDKRQSYMDRITNIYNVTTNAIKHQDPKEYEKMIKRNQWVNMYSDLLGSAYGYGISFYNTFEWASLSPLISSWKSVGNTFKTFALNKETANNWTDFIKNVHIMDNQLQYLDATIANDIPSTVNSSRDVLDTMQTATRKMHQVSANFSFSKQAGRLIGWDVENAGMWRLFIDGFQGGNEVATAMNGRSALYEARKMGEVYRKLIQSGESVINFDGKQWNDGRIRRALERYGISGDKFDRWIENYDKLDSIVEKIDNGENVAKLLADQEFAEAGQLTIDVLQSATHTMHGTNKFLRPEFASSPAGRMVYKYQTYPFNFAFQNVKERIVRPLREFKSKHLVTGDGSKKVDMSLAKIYYNYKRGNFDKLKKAGFTDRAIKDMPIEVYEHIQKLLVSVFGISVAGNMGLGFVSDLVEYPMAEATDQETFWRTKKNFTLNPTSPKSEQMTLGDFFDQPTFDGTMKMMWYAMGQAYQSGVAGAYGNLLQNRYDSDKGLLDLTMLGSDVNDVFRAIRKTSTAGVYDWAPTLTEESLKVIQNKLPIISSRPFSGYKTLALRELFKEEKSKKGLDFNNVISSLEDNGESVTFQY